MATQAVCASLVFCITSAFTCVVAVGPKLARHMGVSAPTDALIGAGMLSLPLLTNLPSLYFGVWLARRVGLARLTRVSHGVLTVAFVLSGCTSDVRIFLLLRAVCGVAAPSLGLARHVTSHVPSTALALLAAMLVGPLVGAALYDEASARPHALATWCLGALCAVVLFTIPPWHDTHLAEVSSDTTALSTQWDASLARAFSLRLVVYATDQTLIIVAQDMRTSRLAHLLLVSNLVAFGTSLIAQAHLPRTLAHRTTLHALTFVFVAVLVAAPWLPWTPLLLLRGVGYGLAVMACSAHVYAPTAHSKMIFQLSANVAILVAPLLAGAAWTIPLSVPARCAIIGGVLGCVYAATEGAPRSAPWLL